MRALPCNALPFRERQTHYCMGRNGLLGLLGRTSKGTSEDGMSTIPTEVHKAESGTLAVKNQEISNRIAVWRSQAEELVVTNSEDYAATLGFLKELRTYKKAVGFEKDPGIDSAKQHLDFLREDKAKHIRPLDAIDKVAAQKAADWKENERLAAAAEERRVNEQRRRDAAENAAADRRAAEAAAEAERKRRQKVIDDARKSGEVGKREANKLAKEVAERAERDKKAAREAEEAAANVKDVKVKADIPTVAGTMGRTNWKFRVVNPDLVPRAYLHPNEVAIGGMVRNTKDKRKAEAKCPGIEVWSKDAV